MLEIILKEKGGAKTEQGAFHVEGTAQAGAGSRRALGLLGLVVTGEKEVRLESQTGEGLEIKKVRSLSENKGLLV